MPTKQTIVILKPEAELPVDFLKALAEKHETAFGYAVANGDEVEFTHVSLEPDEKEQQVDVIKTVEDLRSTYKSDMLVMNFAMDEGGLLEEDQQPFTIVKDNEDKAQIVAFVEGEFPSFVSPEGFSNEYEFVRTKLSEMVKKVYTESKDDLDKTALALATGEVREKAAAMLKPRGHITLVFADGSDPVTYSDNELGRDFPWGYSSRHWGFASAEEKKTTEDPAAKKRAEILARRKAAQTPTVGHNGGPPFDADPPKDLEPINKPGKTSVPGVHTVTDTRIPKDAGKETGELLVFMPKNVPAGKAQRQWHKNNFGSIPNSAKIHEGRPYKDLKANSILRKTLGNGLKDVANAKTGDAVETRVSDHPALAPPGQVKELLERVKRGDVKPLTLEQIKESVQEYLPFSEQVGIPVSDLLLWNNKSYRALDHQMLFCLCNQFRHMLIDRSLSNAIVEREEKEAAPAEETPAATPELSPAEKKRAEILARRRASVAA